MEFQVILTLNAERDIRYFSAYEQRLVIEAIKTYLWYGANVESNRRKRLRANDLAPWELRAGKFRVFYEFEEEKIVKVIAVGYKEHNDLFIRGEKVKL